MEAQIRLNLIIKMKALCMEVTVESLDNFHSAYIMA